MKPALVLGLALAANAMAADQGDNELIIAPTGKFDRDLAHRFPGKIMYDEVADDELYKGFPARENFSTYEEWLRATRRYDADDEFLVRPLVPHVTADDEELFVAPQGKLAELAKKYPGMIMFDEQADDEELFFAAGQRIGNLANGRPTLMLDDAADDELGLKIVHLPVAETVAYDDELLVVDKDPREGTRRFIPYFDKETRTWKIGPAQLASFDDDEYYVYHKSKKPIIEQADDELAVKLPVIPLGQRSEPKFGGPWERFEKYGRTVSWAVKEADDDELFAEVADDELAVKIVHLPVTEAVAYDDDENYVYHKSKKPIIEQADDELALKIVHLPVTETVAYDDDELAVMLAPRSAFKTEEEFQRSRAWARAHPSFDDAADEELAVKIVNLPAGENGNVAFDDDELAFIARAPRVVVDKSLLKPAKITTSEALVRDDDELLYLGQLIQDKAWIPRTFDDELRAEKPSHVKAEERAQMKSELPKMQRKFRPHPDVIPMAQN